MKLKTILAIICAVLMLSLLKGCDCDVPRVYDFDKNITLDRSNIEVDPSGNAIATILDGNGNYTLRSTNDTIATATLDGNKINIKGLASGKTAIIVTDSKKVNAIVKVLVYSNLVVETDTVDIVTNGTKFVKIISGNGGYRFDLPNNIDASIEQRIDGTFIKFMSNDIEMKDAPATIYDRTGKSVILSLTVSEPLSFEFKGHVKMNDIDKSPNMIYYNEISDDKRMYGWQDTDESYFWMYIRFPDGDFSVGSKNDAEIWFDFYSAPYGDRSYIGGWEELDNFEIIKNDGSRIWMKFTFQDASGYAVQRLP